MRPPLPAGPTGIVEPLPLSLERLLRRAVADHARDLGRKRTFVPTVHVGLPGGIEHTHVIDAGQSDHALRTDIVATMASSVAAQMQPWTPIVWLARLGPLEPTEGHDLDWLAAAISAYAELGAPLLFVVVERRGWRDPRSEVGRHWVKLRVDAGR